MNQIKTLIKSMYMELKAADCYYEKAIKFKEDYPQLASVYIEIASQELTHCDKFHSAAVSLINKYKSTNKEVPESMQAIWEFEHTCIIEEYDELKYKISKFN